LPILRRLRGIHTIPIGGVGLHSEGGAPPPFGIKVISLIHPSIFKTHPPIFQNSFRSLIRKIAFKQNKIKVGKVRIVGILGQSAGKMGKK